MDEFVILVDGNDNPIGKEEKVKCHLPNGKPSQSIYCINFQQGWKITLNKKK